MAFDAVKHDLADARALLDSVLDQVGNRWENQIYSDGAAWTARQLVIHLANADRGHNNQIMGIVAGKEVIPPDFDIERYNRRSVEKQAEMTPEEGRAALSETRAALLAWLDTADESILTLSGRHASLNILTLDQFFRVMSDHERQHAREMATALGIAL